MSCGDEALPVPKPRSYPRVYYPERDYVRTQAEHCDFSFDVPASAEVEQQELFFDRTPPDSCWFDVVLDDRLNGSVHFSYYPVDSYATWENLREEAFELVGVHNDRASNIEEIVIHRDDADVHGLAFDISGPTASPFQFFLTDTTNHFVRGALYFNVVTEPDSLGPVIEYVKEDIFRMVESFAWER